MLEHNCKKISRNCDIEVYFIYSHLRTICPNVHCETEKHTCVTNRRQATSLIIAECNCNVTLKIDQETRVMVENKVAHLFLVFGVHGKRVFCAVV